MKLLKFFGEWCNPCKQQSKLLENFKTVPIIEIDVDEEPDMAGDFNIRSLPTMILVDDENKEITRFVGLTKIEEIETFIDENN